MISTPTYQGPDRRVSGDRRRVERRVRFDDVPMVVDRRRVDGDRRRGERRNQAALILNTRMLRRRDESSPA